MNIHVKQLEIPEQMNDDLEKMRSDTGITSFKNLFNVALTILQWIITKWLAGNKFYSFNEVTGETSELALDKLFPKEAAKKEEDQKDESETNDNWPDVVEYTSSEKDEE